MIWFVSTLLCYISYKLALIILGLYTHGTYRNFFFLTLSTQHNILISIHVAGCIRGLFLFIVSSIHCMNLTVYPFPCWWISGWFGLLWINLIGHCKRLFVDICFQFSWIGIGGSKVRCVLSFLINCQTTFQTSCAIYMLSPAQSMRILVVSNSVQHLVVLFGLFHFGHTCDYVTECFWILLQG